MALMQNFLTNSFAQTLLCVIFSSIINLKLEINTMKVNFPYKTILETKLVDDITYIDIVKEIAQFASCDFGSNGAANQLHCVEFLESLYDDCVCDYNCEEWDRVNPYLKSCYKELVLMVVSFVKKMERTGEAKDFDFDFYLDGLLDDAYRAANNMDWNSQDEWV